MNTFAQQAPQHIHAQYDQHQTHGKFESLSQSLGNDTVHPQHEGAEQKQGQGMTDTPYRSLPDGTRDTGAARRRILVAAIGDPQRPVRLARRAPREPEAPASQHVPPALLGWDELLDPIAEDDETDFVIVLNRG